MASKRDYYEVLGVERTASDKRISEAYRKLALEYHPDRNPGDEEAVTRFKEAAEAFEVLHNSQKRATYDRFGHQGLEGAAGGSPHFHDVGDIFSAFGDIFGDIFGARQGQRVHRGGDVECQVTLDLREAAKGATQSVTFTRHRACKTCKGSRAKPGTKPETCQYCGGRGHVLQSSGFFSMQTACPGCKGTGTIVKHPCTTCHGVGYVREEVTRDVQIPPGVDNHTQLRLQGEGDPSPDGGPPGNCYCHIVVRSHPLFERDGQHLICQMPITYPQAALGATLEVPTLDGRQEFDLPQGTQSGEVFRLRGLGMPDPRRRGRGDLLIQVHIEVPKKLDQKHEEILRELADIERAQVTPKRKSFFESVKEWWNHRSEQEEMEN